MKSLSKIALLLSSLMALPASAEFVMEMVTRDMAGKELDKSLIYGRSGDVRMDVVQGDDVPGSLLLVGDDIIYLDHPTKTYVLMDEAMFDDISSQMSEAMKMMEAELANLPPEQRAMVEEMMKGELEGLMGGASAPAVPMRIESKGADTWKGYACKRYETYEGSTLINDVCLADLDNVTGVKATNETFRNMALKLARMAESLPMQPGTSPNLVELIEEAEGVPVHAITYENGKAVNEMTLESVVEQSLDAGLFTPPSDYRKRDPLQ
jgi:hypothetical protein